MLDTAGEEEKAVTRRTDAPTNVLNIPSKLSLASNALPPARRDLYPAFLPLGESVPAAASSLCPVSTWTVYNAAVSYSRAGVGQAGPWKETCFRGETDLKAAD